MYQYLRGKLIEKKPTEITLEVSGVGYVIQIPVSTHTSLPSLGQEVKVLTHQVVREDAHLLFGFASDEEREIFRLLISVSGIGPKMGLTVLSGMSLRELKRSIVDGSVHTLTGIPGIGKKTAERMIVELREKMVLSDQKTEEASFSLGGAEDQIVEDSLQALVQLGYRKPNARNAIQKVLQSPGGSKLSVEDLIRESLKFV